MTPRTIDRLVAAGVLVYALVLYGLTVAPTASFWDSGEFIAIAHGLQVSHPPGAPFYMLVGRLFSMVLAPVIGLFTETGSVAIAVNLVSVVASALTVLLTHLVIVRLVRIWKGAPEGWTGPDRLAALAGGAIGACTFAVTDSFWFNAVEAEVYALSMFFTAIVVWLTLRWREEKLAEEAALSAQGEHPFGLRSDRYLVLIAYLFGLAIGVHLLNVLTLFFIALIVYFAEFDRDEMPAGRRVAGVLVAGVVAAACFLVIYPGIIQTLPTWAGASGAPVLFLLAVVGLVVGAVWYTQRRRWPVANIAAVSVMMLLVGYSTYALIFIRSAADPPIDENDPETVDAIVSYLKREQYGATPLLRGASFDDAAGRVGTDEELFPRRWSPMPEHGRFYARYGSDWDFFLNYQVGHMYVRYFLWQFAGRESDEEGAAWTSGLVPARDDGDNAVMQMTRGPSERSTRNVYYGLPLLLGLFGLGFHIARDWRRALAVGVLFLITGIGIILYLNQTPMQPRERDYSYVASFFAYSLWIGLGATGLVALAADWFRRRGRDARSRLLAGGAVAGLLFLAVPGLMLVQNYDDHDRSGRYVAPDFAHNMLQSLAPNAIIFTNGDNDTFPLWYLQEVEGVRRDVRVVNLSLLQTDWYIKQLKNQWSRESAPLPLDLTDEEVERLQPVQWEPRELGLPVRDVSSETRAEWGNPVRLPEELRWTVQGRPYSRNIRVLYVNDLVTLRLLEAVAHDGWQRPIYFATTASQSAQLGLEDYLQAEGLALRVTPIEDNAPGLRVVPEVALERLSKFRFTNLDDPGAYLDANARSMVDNYRSAVFGPAARRLADEGREAEARALLDRIREAAPFETVPPDFVSLYSLAEAYAALDDTDEVVALMQRAEPEAVRRLAEADTEQGGRVAMQYYQTVLSFYLEAGAYGAAEAFSARVATALGDPSWRQSAEDYRAMVEARERPAPAATDSTG